MSGGIQEREVTSYFGIYSARIGAYALCGGEYTPVLPEATRLPAASTSIEVPYSLILTIDIYGLQSVVIPTDYPQAGRLKCVATFLLQISGAVVLSLVNHLCMSTTILTLGASYRSLLMET